MSAAADEAVPTRVKGLAFRSVIAWYEERYGEGRLAAVAREREREPWLEEVLALDEPALGVIPNRWYPTEVTHALAGAVCAGLSEAEFEELATGSAQWIMRDTVRGLYKLLFDWIATPARFIKYSSRVWVSYYDHGSFELTAVGERRIEARITNWAAYHRLIFSLTRKVVFMMFEEMGCKVISQPAHCEEGAEGLNAFVIEWSQGKTVVADPLAEKELSGVYDIVDGSRS